MFFSTTAAVQQKKPNSTYIHMYQIIESFHIISINTKYYIITYRKYPLVIQLQYYKDERRGCDRTMFAVFGAPYNYTLYHSS